MTNIESGSRVSSESLDAHSKTQRELPNLQPSNIDDFVVDLMQNHRKEMEEMGKNMRACREEVHKLRVEIINENTRRANACTMTGALVGALAGTVTVLLFPEPVIGSSLALKSAVVAMKAAAVITGSGVAGAGAGWVVGQALVKKVEG
jgi:hypothetical protein